MIRSASIRVFQSTKECQNLIPEKGPKQLLRVYEPLVNVRLSMENVTYTSFTRNSFDLHTAAKKKGTIRPVSFEWFKVGRFRGDH